MISRTTMSQTVRNFLADLHGNSRLLDRAQREVSTGKRILAPADDPLGIAAALRLRRDQAASATWQRNIEDSLTWLSATDVALGNALDVVHRARELAVQGANGALSASGRAIIADEIDQLVQQLVEIGNATLGGRHLFAGTKTQTPAFDAAGTYLGNGGQLVREIELGTTVAVNVTGDRLAGPGAPVPDVFATLTTLAADLSSGNLTGVQGALQTLDAHIANINGLRGEVGGRTNTLEVTLGRLRNVEVEYGNQLSTVEDADMALAITELKSRESIYRASLGVGGRLLPPSLLDFLK
jgi:flagellar hook-associated protein 3 FlgL